MVSLIPVRTVTKSNISYIILCLIKKILPGGIKNKSFNNERKCWLLWYLLCPNCKRVCRYLTFTQLSEEICIAGKWNTYETCFKTWHWKLKQNIYQLVFQAKCFDRTFNQIVAFGLSNYLFSGLTKCLLP